MKIDNTDEPAAIVELRLCVQDFGTVIPSTALNYSSDQVSDLAGEGICCLLIRVKKADPPIRKIKFT